jgi:ABC-type antimicrobial peptide transport system permease subunit
MALGVHPRDIFRLVVSQGMGLTLTGLVLGIVAALAAGSLLASILFGANQTDPLTFLAVSPCCSPPRSSPVTSQPAAPCDLT